MALMLPSLYSGTLIPEQGRGPKVVEVEANYTLTNVCNNFGSRTTRFKLEVL
ncbi:hypothetical protein [Salmonella phage ST17]|nr:hypothetical protein [Salmonella phage ST17]